MSRSKKSGEISDLLDELDEANREAEGQPTAGDKRVERWLLTDWREPSRRKEPALPMLPKSKFNSGDNPILAAAALILSFGVAKRVAERATALLRNGACANPRRLIARAPHAPRGEVASLTF